MKCDESMLVYESIEKKVFEYDRYVKNHIEDVCRIWNEINLGWSHVKQFEDDRAIILSFINWQTNMFSKKIEKHDESKLKLEEFTAYRKWFYPAYSGEACQDEFNIAWLHHCNFNSHHWQHWIMYDRGKSFAMKMPNTDVLEMIIDWSAMSLRFDGSPLEWYRSKKDEMLLHNETRKNVESLLRIFDKLVKYMRVEGN